MASWKFSGNFGTQSTRWGVKPRWCRPRGSPDKSPAPFTLKLSLLDTSPLTRHPQWFRVRPFSWNIHLQPWCCYVMFRIHTTCYLSCLANVDPSLDLASAFVTSFHTHRLPHLPSSLRGVQKQLGRNIEESGALAVELSVGHHAHFPRVEAISYGLESTLETLLRLLQLTYMIVL